MSVQKIPLDAVQKIRQYIKNALVLPDFENQPKSWSGYEEADELPEPEMLSDLGELFNFGGPIEATTNAPNVKGQWFISTSNPGIALQKLPGLRLKEGLRLVSYLYRQPNEGLGVTWALPEEFSTTSQLEKVLNSESKSTPANRENAPRPVAALEDLMQAIEGDRTPISFLVASILRRELREFGAIGKSASWSHHRLVATPPTQVNWQWRIEPPKDFSPKVRVLPDGRAAIEFFTCRVSAPIALFQHIDQYAAMGYQSNTVDRAIAVAAKA